jgi:hypothetical protein
MYGIAKGGAQRLQPVFTGIGVFNFKFQIAGKSLIREWQLMSKAEIVTLYPCSPDG